MRKSTNFELNLVEGNDLVNPLVQDVPNYEKIDEQMYKNECNSIGIATELKSGTVHALTRTIPNASMFRFKATSNFTAGDTFTVDGVQVSALTPNGETLASGCYIVGSEVLCTLRETLLTVYLSGGVVTTAQDSEKLGGQLPEYYGTAENVSTALTTAQSANQLTLNLQTRVNEINSNLDCENLITHTNIKSFSCSQQNMASTSGTTVEQTFTLPNDIVKIKKMFFTSHFTDGLGNAKLNSWSISENILTMSVTLTSYNSQYPCSWGMQIYYI